MSELTGYMQSFIAQAPELQIALWQVLLFVFLTSVAALYERYRFILILSYCFMAYWVFIENGSLLADHVIWVTTGFVFLVSGLLAMLMTLYHMFTRHD